MRLFLANIGTRSLFYPLATPPLGLLYLAAYLRSKHSLDIQVVNQRIEDCSFEEIAKKTIDFEADIVGLGSMTPSAHGLSIVAGLIREARPQSFIVLGGPHVSSFGVNAFAQTDADAAIAGEGELSMEMLVDALSNGSSPGHIPGLMWRDKNRDIIVNPGSAPLIENLDDLPMPAYDLIDLKRYWTVQSMPPIPRRKYISLVSSRGCPYACMWCHRIFGRQYRTHSADRIVSEIQYYASIYGIDDVEFLDDAFNLDRRRVFDYAQLLLEKRGPIKTAFPNALRGDLLEEDIVHALKESGTYFSSFALESGSPRIQEFTGKRLNIPRFLEAIALAVRNGIFTNGFMMLGFPTETEAEMEETIRVATNSMLHTASFFTVTPFPNTPLYDYLMQHNPEKISGISYSNVDFCTARINLSAVPDDVLYAYQRKAQRRFFLKPDRIYRLLRDFPQRRRLPQYLPIYLNRALKGLIR